SPFPSSVRSETGTRINPMPRLSPTQPLPTRGSHACDQTLSHDDGAAVLSGIAGRLRRATGGEPGCRHRTADGEYPDRVAEAGQGLACRRRQRGLDEERGRRSLVVDAGRGHRRLEVAPEGNDSEHDLENTGDDEGAARPSRHQLRPCAVEDDGG